MEDIKKWLWEGLKTAGRFALFAFVSAFLDTLTKNLAGVSMPDDVKWAITLGLTMADKALHERNKEVGSDNRGIAPF